MAIFEFISAFGLGAIVTSVVQAWTAQHSEMTKRNFTEKKESYVGYLDALHQSETDQTFEASLSVGHWQNRIDLVGSGDVIRACSQMQRSNPVQGNVHPERPKAMRDLKDSMRRDLGIARSRSFYKLS